MVQLEDDAAALAAEVAGRYVYFHRNVTLCAIGSDSYRYLFTEQSSIDSLKAAHLSTLQEFSQHVVVVLSPSHNIYIFLFTGHPCEKAPQTQASSIDSSRF